MEEKNGSNQTAFEAFVRNYGPQAFMKAYRLTGNRADAQDLVQETLQKLAEYWEQYEPPRRIECLFAVIMRNAFIDKRRRCKRLCSLERRTGGEPGYHDLIAHPEPDMLDRLIREETTRKVKACLRKLRPTYRQVLTLADMEGKQYAVVADELNVPLGTMKSRLSRARASFRKHANGLSRMA